MNQGGYFGAYQSGFQTLPKGAYEMMTAPTQQLASTISNLAGTAAGAYKGYQAQKAGDKAFKQGAAAQYKGLESLSQATGVPVNPELANQYLNIGNMSQQEQAMFNQSLGQEAQNLMARYNISQAQARAAQAAQGQGMQQAGAQVDYMISGRNQPRVNTPPVNSGGFQISNAGIASIMGLGQPGTGFKFLK